jgi:hypothetical protein
MTDNLENTYYKKYLKYKAKYLDLVERMRGGGECHGLVCGKICYIPEKKYVCEKSLFGKMIGKKKENVECKEKKFGSECKKGLKCLKQKDTFTCQKPTKK